MPTFQKIGKYDHSLGKVVAEMFTEEGGASFYPSQEYELELMLARNADGSPAAQVMAISKPRQNGKSYGARYYAIYMADFEHRSVMYSAHHSSTTKKMFDAMCALVENKERYPEFANDVKRITRGRGYEGIYFKDWKDKNGEWHDGGCIEFSTRTNAGARGGTYSVIIVDEAQELTSDQQEGLLPVISAASDAKDETKLPQQIYIGTPNSPSCNGTVFKNMHQNAHSGEDTKTWWLEWAIDSIDELLPRSADKAVELAYKTNPALGYRIAEKTIVSEFENMVDIGGFARERLGWWMPIIEKKEDFAIDKDAWDACASNEKKPDGKTAYGVKFSADGMEISLCGAVVDKDNVARISLIERRPTSDGVKWLADWLNARYSKACCVVIDGRNGVDVLIDKIAQTWRMKGSVIRASTKDMMAAVSTLSNEINEQTITWYKPQEMLNESAVTSVKRPLSGGWAFGGENSTPIEACALALWGVRTSRRDPSKRMRIG